jgi:hypothetical protein
MTSFWLEGSREEGADWVAADDKWLGCSGMAILKLE